MRGKVGSVLAVTACVLVLFGALQSRAVPADGPIPHGGGRAIAAAVAAGAAKNAPLDRDAVAGEVVLLTGSSPVEQQLMQGLLKGFSKRYPKVQVRFVAINRDYPTVVLTRFAAGDAPDVFTVDGKFFEDWSSKGLLLPLDGYLRSERIDTSRYRPQLLESVRGPRDMTYALPQNYSTVSLFTNDAMLKAAGIDRPPTNWEELESAARKLTTKGGGTGAHTGLCLVPTWERMLLFALQQDGGITNVAGTQMTITSPQTRIAVDWVRRMLASGVATSPAESGSSWCGDAFGKGKVAMALEGAWMLPPMQMQYPNVKYSVHPLPAGARRATLAYSGNLGISSTSKNPDAAWLLLDWISSPESQRTIATAGLGVPAMTGVEYPESLEPFANGLEYATVWSLPPGFFNTVLITADNEMSAVLEGRQTVEGMLRAIDEIGSTMLKAGGSE